MKEKVIKALKEQSKQYGLSDEILSAMADSCLVDTEDAEALEGWVKSQVPVMAAMQRMSDSRVNEAVKRKSVNQTEDVAKLLGEMKQGILDDLKSSFDFESLRSDMESVKAQMSESKNREIESAFREKVKCVGLDMGLSEAVIGMLSYGWKSDMSDEEIKTKMTECRNTLISEGLPEAGRIIPRKSEDAAKAEAKKWVEEQMAKANG